MKELEALEFIVEAFNKYAKKPNDIGEFFKFTNAEETIQKGLTRLEKLEKAIELFKRIGANEVALLLSFNDFNEYIKWYEVYFRKNGFDLNESFIPAKTEDEFKLLKEVFGK